MSHDLPLSHVINVRTLPRKGRHEKAVPDDGVLEQMARHLGVERLEEVELTADVTPWKREGLKVEGWLKAKVEQACVVTLDPVDSTLDESFETHLVPEGSRLSRPPSTDAEMVLDAEGSDPPETFEGDTIDLASIWMEFLALSIDPFPRRPDAKMPEDVADETPSPFAALAALKAANDG